MDAIQRTLPINSTVHDFLIMEVLGQGGFGITYKAHDPRLSRFVVIKEYMPQDLAVRQGGRTVYPHSGNVAKDFQWGLDSFLKEAQTLARFQHTNIVPVLDFFEENGTAYLVMPFIEGETLGDYRKRLPSGVMSEQEVMQWFVPLLDGLQAIHAQGILHRDIKPDNIFLASNGSPILIDFGAARNALTNHSRSLSVVLTAGYAPPEQYSSTVMNQGPWTDMYALGAVLYCCLTGQNPVDSTERQDSQMNGEEDPLTPYLHDLSSRINPVLASVLEKCLCVARTGRMQGVAELRHMLSEYHGPSDCQNQASYAAQSSCLYSPTSQISNADVGYPSADFDSRVHHAPTSTAPSSLLKTEQRPTTNMPTKAIPTKAIAAVGLACILGATLWYTTSDTTQPVTEQVAMTASTKKDSTVTPTEKDSTTTTLVASVQPSPKPSPTSPSSTEPSPVPKSATVKQVEVAPVEVAPPFYNVAISTAPPNARIAINGKEYKDGTRLENGTYTVLASAEGYESLERALTVDGKNVSMELSLQRILSVEDIYEQGETLFAQKKYSEALPLLQDAANKEHMGAQFRLGMCYEDGLGVVQDYKQAFTWYEKSTLWGHIEAAHRLGICLYKGQGTERDYGHATLWFKIAADDGFAPAQTALGVCYLKGQGVDKDEDKALACFRSAAQQGYKTAQNILESLNTTW